CAAHFCTWLGNLFAIRGVRLHLLTALTVLALVGTACGNRRPQDEVAAAAAHSTSTPQNSSVAQSSKGETAFANEAPGSGASLPAAPGASGSKATQSTSQSSGHATVTGGVAAGALPTGPRSVI